MSRDAVTPWDWSQSYLLPDHVRSNIPLRGSVGSPGAYNVARGLLVEICRATAAVPMALHYAESELVAGTSSPASLITFTATVALSGGTSVVVVTRNRQHAYDDRDDDWTIQLDDVVLHAESRRYPPSPPYQGHIVAWHLAARRRR